MDNLNISYAEGWQKANEVTRYESVSDTDAIEEKTPVKRKKLSFPMLITLQFIISALLVLSAFAIKQIGGEVYKTVKKTYDENINNEIILKDSFESFSLNTLPDEAEN